MSTRLDVSQRKQALHEELSGTRVGARAGALVPPVRELAARHGLSLRSVNLELQKLAARGLLYSVPRVGTFIAGEKKNAPKGDTVALLSPHSLEAIDLRPSGWTQAVDAGASHGVHEHEHHVLTLHPRRFVDEIVVAEDIERLAMRHLSGMLITDLPGAEGHLHKLLGGLQQHAIPVVAMSDHPAFKHCDRVVSDHEAGAFALTQFFANRGARRIQNVWFAPADGYWFALRQAGYERALEEANLRVLPTLRPPTSALPKNAAAFERAASQLATALQKSFKNQTPDVLLAASDGHVPLLAAALKILGLEPNRDVMLGGYDNYWSEAPTRAFESTPPMATVDKHNTQLGERAAEMLFARIAGHLPEPPVRQVITPQLVEIGAESAASYGIAGRALLQEPQMTAAA